MPHPVTVALPHPPTFLRKIVTVGGTKLLIYITLRLHFFVVLSVYSNSEKVLYFLSWAEFLDEIQTKNLRVFLLAIHSHLYSFALRFIFLRTHATSYSFYCTLQRRKEENVIENHTHVPMVWEIVKETSSLWTLKIMPRHLNEIVRSWIRLPETIIVSRPIYYRLGTVLRYILNGMHFTVYTVRAARAVNGISLKVCIPWVQ